MPKCDFNKVALQLCWNRTSPWVFSCKFAAYFQNNFSYEHLCVAASDKFYGENWNAAMLFVIEHVSAMQKQMN